MSSLPRRIQKNIAKGMGFKRDKASGMIVNSNGEPVGTRWPHVVAPTKQKGK